MNIKVHEGIWGLMSESEKTLCMMADYVQIWSSSGWEDMDKGYTPEDGDVFSWWSRPYVSKVDKEEV